MQYLNDQHGNPVGVFMSMNEWADVQCKMGLPSREEWHRKAVEKGLDSLHSGEFAPEERMKSHFERMGVHAD